MYKEIEQLLEKYYEGETTLQEEQHLRDFFCKNNVPPHLYQHIAEFGYYVKAKNELPSAKLNEQLIKEIQPKSWLIQLTTLSRKMAAGVLLLLGGFVAGYLYNNYRHTNLTFTNSSVSAMKKKLEYTTVSQTSASERIDAVNQSLKLTKLDQEIAQLLINTLNFDDNINVRLAACQALAHFENEPLVREGLMQSLKIQTDPNIQIMLIEVLVYIKENRASPTLEQLSQDKMVMDVVRLKAEEGAAQLKGHKVV